jgi:hypothetical protein
MEIPRDAAGELSPANVGLMWRRNDNDPAIDGIPKTVLPAMPNGDSPPTLRPRDVSLRRSDSPTGPRRRAIFVAKLERYPVRGARLVRLHERAAQCARRSARVPFGLVPRPLWRSFDGYRILDLSDNRHDTGGSANPWQLKIVSLASRQTRVLVRGCRGLLPASAGHSPFTRKSSRSACNSTIEITVIRYWNGCSVFNTSASVHKELYGSELIVGNAD